MLTGAGGRMYFVGGVMSQNTNTISFFIDIPAHKALRIVANVNCFFNKLHNESLYQ